MHSHPHPQISVTNPPFFSIFQPQNPYFCPHFSTKTPIPRTKKHTNTGISMSFAPAFANGRYISVRDAGAVPSVVGVPAVHSVIGAGHCRHTKNRSHNYFSTTKILRTPFDSSKYGCFCNKYGHVFPILKTRINRHVKGPKYLIVSNLFLLY